MGTKPRAKPAKVTHRPSSPLVSRITRLPNLVVRGLGRAFLCLSVCALSFPPCIPPINHHTSHAALHKFTPRSLRGVAAAPLGSLPATPPVSTSGGLLMGWLVPLARRDCNSQQHTSSTRRGCCRCSLRWRVGALVSLVQRVLLYSYVASAATSPLNENVSAELLAEFELPGSLARLGPGSAPRQLQDSLTPPPTPQQPDFESLPASGGSFVEDHSALALPRRSGTRRLEDCSNTCYAASDGDCDDGGSGSAYSGCSLGTDCVDCGSRASSGSGALSCYHASGSGTCSGYGSCGYTCVGSNCARMGCECSCSTCAVEYPGRTLDSSSGTCMTPELPSPPAPTPPPPSPPSQGFISAGWKHACGVSSSGMGYCWGYDGALHPAHDTAQSNNRTSVPSGVTWAAISAGFEHSCGVSETGTGYCWGGSNYDRATEFDTYRASPGPPFLLAICTRAA